MKLIFIILISCCHLFGMAQPVKHTTEMNGTVVDSTTRRPASYISVTVLHDGRTVNGALTGKNGAFTLKNIPSGVYDVVFSGLGFKDKQIQKIVVTNTSQELSLGMIELAAHPMLLETVEIKGQAPAIENQIDKIIYHAEKDLGATAGDGADVLRRAPQVVVDAQGTPSLRGNSNLRLLINGKPSGLLGNSPADALRAIPASQIKSVEIITSPASNYDAEGSAGIINIVLKKATKAGLQTNFNTTLGTLRSNANTNITFQNRGLTLTGNAGGNTIWQQAIYGSAQRQDQRFDTRVYQAASLLTSRQGWNTNLGMDLDLTSKSSILIGISLMGSNQKANGAGPIAYESESGISRIQRSTAQSGWDRSVNVVADYRRQLRRKGEEIVLSGQFNSGSGRPEYHTQLAYGNGSFFAEKSNGRNLGREQTAQIDYKLPGPKGAWAMGAKVINRDLQQQRNVYQDNELTDSYQINPLRSNRLLYQQTVSALYATLDRELTQKLSLKIGGRLESTWLKGTSISETLYPVFRQRYSNFFPYLAIMKRFEKDQQTIRAVYNKRLQRPGSGYLNPYISASDPFNRSQGNPYLKPELAHQFELSYSYTKDRHSVNLALYYRLTTQLIESYTSLSRDTLQISSRQSVVATDNYGNIGALSGFGLNAFGSLKLSDNWSLRGSLNVSTYELVLRPQYIPSITQVSWQGSLNGSTQYQFKRGYGLEVSGVYNSPRRTVLGWQNHFSFFSLNFRKQLSKGFMQLNVTEPFQGQKLSRRETKGDGFNQIDRRLFPYRAVNLSLNLNLGKDLKPRQRNSRISNDDLK